MSANGLRSALAALDAYWAERDPAWAAGLQPGLTEEAISSAEVVIAPLRLTAEQRVLYGWHDGDGESHVFGQHWPEFISLAKAIESWRFGSTQLGWTPCWFPLLNYDQDYRIAVVDSVPEESSGVLDFFLQDEPKALVPSIEALVSWYLDCLKHGLWEPKSAADKLREPYKGPILVRGQPISDRVSATFARDWPSAWKEAAGIDEAAEVPVGPTVTIEKLLSGEMAGGVVEGRVTWFGGGLESSIVEIDDGTGRILIACPKDTPGARELGMYLVMEMAVKPRQGPVGEDLNFVEGLMGHAPFVAESVRFVRSLRPEDVGQGGEPLDPSR